MYKETRQILKDDELELWQKTMADITSSSSIILPQHSAIPPQDIVYSTQKQKINKHNKAHIKVEGSKLPLSKPSLNITSNTEKLLSGAFRDVNGKLRKKLSRGEFPITARLDLHGCKTDIAHRKLQDFLHQTAVAKHRCVLIICGKGRGYGPNGNMGLIKSEISGWLSIHPKVLAFCTAQPKDGGHGALYIYLKKQPLKI